MINEPQQLYIKTYEFYVEYIEDELSLDEYIKQIKSHFDFSDPNYEHKIVPYRNTIDGGDYNDDYDETTSLELITYRMETQEEANLRVEEFNRKEKEQIEKEKIIREARSKHYKEQCKIQSKEMLKEWYDKASEYYTIEEIESIIKHEDCMV